MKKYRTTFIIEELWVKILSEDCPYSREIVFAEKPSESPEDDTKMLEDAISVWEAEYKHNGLVTKPIKTYYYKLTERFTREGRYNGK